MDQDTIRELMQTDLEATGLNPDDYFKEKKSMGLRSPPQWYCKACLKEYRYKGALENHIYSIHRPKDRKGYASWAEVLERIGSINDPRRPRRTSCYQEIAGSNPANAAEKRRKR